MQDLQLNMEKKTVIVFGASGLIGRHLVDELLVNDAFEFVKAVYRKNPNFSHPKLIPIIADYHSITNKLSELVAHIVFSCLGTTRQDTPDKKTYYQIDHDYPLKVATLLKKVGANQFHLISSIGANASSKTFYIRMKGETERDISAIGMESLYIYRPSLLVGKRLRTRPAERLFIWIFKIINPLLAGPLKKYQSITANTVAKAMVKQALNAHKGTFILETDAIKQLA
ncbi:Uncharacterized conserved protein YbjT, contains NAD(P)-binding and DUF2867 domains [bacterium A37T11]|nr:Uncharacterized conserved protein YbjT, contains NAD(P)-binding and DUF2867 domains [bacterium A37T11]